MSVVTSTRRRPLLIVATATLAVSSGLLAAATLVDNRNDTSMDEKFSAWVADRTPETVTVIETHCNEMRGERGICYLTLDTVDSPSDTTPVRSDMFCRVYTLNDGDIHGQCPQVPWLPTI